MYTLTKEDYNAINESIQSHDYSEDIVEVYPDQYDNEDGESKTTVCLKPNTHKHTFFNAKSYISLTTESEREIEVEYNCKVNYQSWDNSLDGPAGNMMRVKDIEITSIWDVTESGKEFELTYDPSEVIDSFEDEF